MATLQYVKPMEFVAGQVLGRAHLGVLRDNDDFFNALADRYRPVVAGVVRDWDSGDSVSLIVWDGWHLKRDDMDTLYYYAELANDDGGHPTTLTAVYDYNDDVNDTQIFTRNTTGTSSGTLDISGFPEGLYRVVFTITRAGGDVGYDATVKIRPPYSIYTGALAYAAGPAFTDADVSAAADFNDLRDNDIYFDAITPAQAAVGGMCRETTLANQTLEIFNGYDKFHPDHLRMYYSVYLDEFDADNIVIYYDADDVVQVQSTSIGAEGITASSWDITDHGYTKGDWYRVRVTLESSANAGWRFGTVGYVYMTAAAADAAYTVMDPFTVGQFVYGTTAGQDTRLALLTANDASIYDRLTWGADIPGRMDFAVAKPSFVTFGSWYHGNYRLKRRGDWLYYRTQNAELVLPDASTVTLDDYSGSGDYNTLDLNSINLAHGQMYSIRRRSYTSVNISGEITTELLEWAMEL